MTDDLKFAFSLTTFEGFYAAYSSAQQGRTPQAAYNHVEDLHTSYFGQPKYASYKSFTETIRYHKKKNRK